MKYNLWNHSIGLDFFIPCFVNLKFRLKHFCYCCLLTKFCLTLWHHGQGSTRNFFVLHYFLEFAQTHVHWVVMPSNHLILCHPLLLPISIFPSIRGFSNESVLHVRWPKYWTFSFSISPFNEYLGLISFMIDWFNLLAVQGVFSRTTVWCNLYASFSSTTVWKC